MDSIINSSPPLSPLPDDVWVDVHGRRFVWTLNRDGHGQWVQVPTARAAPTPSAAPPITNTAPKCTSAPTPPVGPAVNDLWFDTASGFFFIYYYDGTSYQWVVTNPGRGSDVVPPSSVAPMFITSDPGIILTPDPLTGDGSVGVDVPWLDARIASEIPAPPTTLPPSGAAGGALAGTYPNPSLAVPYPTTLPPSGAAGGALAGTYPNPGLAVPYPTTLPGPPTGPAGGALAGTYPNPSLAVPYPTTLPPSGTAGGDLAGTYPNPTIKAGVIPATLPPSGTAGGALAGTYPNPSLAVPYPTTLPPSGAAGGALSGTYPNPNLATPYLPLAGGVMTGTIIGTFGAITANKPFLDGTQTWNNAAVVFNGIKANVIDTAHDAASALLLLQRNSADAFKVDKFGTLITGGGIYNGDIVQSWGRHSAMVNTAVPAGGTQDAGLLFSATPHFGVIFGSGLPSAVMARGSLYLRSDGSPYFNNDGTGSGWLPVVGSGGPPTGAAGGALSGTYPNPGAGNGILRLYDEQILAATATEIRVTIPANAKKVEIEYFIGNNVAATDFTLVMQAMQGAAAYAGATYSAQALQGSGSVGAASFAGGVGSWSFGTAMNFSGHMALRSIVNGWYGNMNEYAISGVGTVFNYGTASRVDVTANTITGFRLISNGGATVFAIGSFVRCFVVT